MEVPWKFHGMGNGSFVEVCKKGAFLFTPLGVNKVSWTPWHELLLY